MSDAYVTEGTRWEDVPRTPDGRPRITVNARAPAQPESPLAPYAPPDPTAQPGAGQDQTVGATQQTEAPQQPEGSPLAPYQEPEIKLPSRQTSNTEATARGVVDSLTFGFSPAIAGLAAASGMPSSAKEEGDVDPNPVRPIVGAAKLLHELLSDHHDPAVVEAYNKGRESFKADNDISRDQHFPAYMAGQLVGALAIPGGIGLRAATTAGRIGRTTIAGGVTGGIYGAGEKTSEGESPAEIAKGAAKGTAMGLAFGAAAGGGSAVAGKAYDKASQLIRGARRPEEEAARRIATGLQQDAEQGAVQNFTPRQQRVSAEAQTPRAIVDRGGGNVRAIARQTDINPAARERLSNYAQDRYEQQNQRISDWIRSKIGGMDTEQAKTGLKSAARSQNKPLYDRAQKVSDARYPGGIWNPKIEQLTSESESIAQAAANALKTGRDRSAAEGYGAFRPKVKYENGRLIQDRAGGSPGYPDLRFWDMVQRELRDMSSAAFRTGRNGEGDAIDQLRRQLVGELDTMVPEFAAARGSARTFFKAIDATDAGVQFARNNNINIAAAAREIAKMSPAERQLFKIGFVSHMADVIASRPDKINIVKQAFVDSPTARHKILLAMGTKDARDFEALLRVEGVVDRLREALGGSMTKRNIAEAGGVAGAVGIVEGAKEGDFNWKTMLGGALAYHAAKSAAHKIDAKTAEHIADLLLSSDPRRLQQGIALVTGKPWLFDAFRTTTNSLAQVSGRDIGPDRAAAGAATVIYNLATAGGIHHGESHHGNNVDPIADVVEPNQ